MRSTRWAMAGGPLGPLPSAKGWAERTGTNRPAARAAREANRTDLVFMTVRGICGFAKRAIGTKSVNIHQDAAAPLRLRAIFFIRLHVRPTHPHRPGRDLRHPARPAARAGRAGALPRGALRTH